MSDRPETENDPVVAYKPEIAPTDAWVYLNDWIRSKRYWLVKTTEAEAERDGLRTIYNKRVSELEAENKRLQAKLDGIRTDRRRLKARLEKLNDNIASGTVYEDGEPSYYNGPIQNLFLEAEDEK